MKTTLGFYRYWVAGAFVSGLLLMASSGGCERKEKLLDIKAPGVNIEINKSGSGKREVEIKTQGNDKKIEIDTGI